MNKTFKLETRNEIEDNPESKKLVSNFWTQCFWTKSVTVSDEKMIFSLQSWTTCNEQNPLSS